MLFASGLIAFLLAGLAAGSLLPDAKAADTDDADSPPPASDATEGTAPEPDGSGDDTLHGGDADDMLDGQAGLDALFGHAGDDMLSGGAGADILSGGSGSDSLWGEDGADWLDGGAGADLLDGGAGDDDLILSHEDTATGGTGADSFYVEKWLSADPGAPAPEILDFETGVDRLVLEFDLSDGPLPILSLDHETSPGDTIVLADSVAMVILRGTGGPALEDIEIAPINGAPPAPVDTVPPGMPDAQTGGPGADTIIGGASGDLIFGDDGNDLLMGMDGGDTLFGEAGDDTLIGGGGSDILSGGEGDDAIRAGAGDTIDSGDGADIVVIDAPDTEEPAILTDFDPSQDEIEILFDPAVTPDPVITVTDLADGTGAGIALNGEIVLKVTGAQGLLPSAIRLVDVTLPGSA